MRIHRILPLALVFSLPTAACNDTTSSEAKAPEEGLFAAADSSAAGLAEQLSYQYLYETQPQLIDGVGEIWTMRVKIDDAGAAHTRLQQTVNSVPVFGGEAIVHVSQSGQVSSVTDNLVRFVDVSTTPNYRSHDAIDFAVDSEGGWRRVTGTPAADLQVLRMGSVDHLAYRVQLELFEPGDEPSMPVVFIDAHTGEELWRYDNLQTARNRNTYTASNGTSLPGSLRRSESQAATTDAVVNQAHDNAGLTYDFYWNTFNRDSFTGSGATITSTVHYSSNYVNAFWNGTQMVYGDGDGTTSTALTVLDVVAHELSHAVTTYEANLTYSGESGALNEANSDIMAAAIEAARDGGVNANTWKLAEECWTPSTSGDALRYMNNPTQDGQSRDHYSTRYTGSSDNGGVHLNSGIANLYFYLLVQGGTHPNASKSLGPVTGIGIDKATRIWYKALTDYMTSSTSFAGARTATLNACSALGYSTECDQVQNAWAEVGVGARADGGDGDSDGDGSSNELQKGVTVSGLSGSTGSWTHYTMNVPAGSTGLSFAMSGGSGDADIYVRFGSQPTSSTYDCRPYTNGNSETCTFASPQTGTYYVSIYAYASYSGVSLVGNYTTGGDGGGDSGSTLEDGVAKTGLSGTTGAWDHYTMVVPSGTSSVSFQISGGTGDADLYVRLGSQPTTSSYACRPYLNGNNETCTFSNPSAGTYYVSLRAYSSYSGVSLVGNY